MLKNALVFFTDGKFDKLVETQLGRVESQQAYTEQQKIAATEGLESLIPNKYALIKAIMQLVYGYADCSHHDGPACSWGGGLMQVASILSSCTLAGKAHGQKEQLSGVSRGGYLNHEQNNTRVAFFGVWGDIDSKQILLSDKNWGHFDKPMYDMMRCQVDNGLPVCTSEWTHDYYLIMDVVIIVIVGEARSKGDAEELFRILIVICRILSVSDQGWGVLSTRDTVHLIWCKYNKEGDKILLKKFSWPLHSNSEDLNGRQQYHRTLCYVMTQIVKAALTGLKNSEAIKDKMASHNHQFYFRGSNSFTARSVCSPFLYIGTKHKFVRKMNFMLQAVWYTGMRSFAETEVSWAKLEARFTPDLEVKAILARSKDSRGIKRGSSTENFDESSSKAIVLSDTGTEAPLPVPAKIPENPGFKTFYWDCYDDRDFQEYLRQFCMPTM